MTITLTILLIILVVILYFTIRKLKFANRRISGLLEEKLVSWEETSKHLKEIESLKEYQKNIAFLSGEAFCQISYQSKNRYIAEADLNANFEYLARIGDLLKAKKNFHNGNKAAEDRFNEVLKEVYGVKEPIPFNDVNLIRIAGNLFCDDYKNYLLNFKPITL